VLITIYNYFSKVDQSYKLKILSSQVNTEQHEL
jgi:hypothetical protein